MLCYAAAVLLYSSTPEHAKKQLLANPKRIVFDTDILSAVFHTCDGSLRGLESDTPPANVLVSILRHRPAQIQQPVVMAARKRCCDVYP
jgi:hypothetical protein